jgi:hypothetical protein
MDQTPQLISCFGTNASVNVLTEAIALGQLPQFLSCLRLPRLSINRGGCWFGCPALNNRGRLPAQPPRSPKC